LVASFFSGGILLTYEVVLFRFLLLFVSSTGLVFAVMLSVVLSGIGLGGLCASFWLKRQIRAHHFLPALAFLSGAVAVAVYQFFSLPSFSVSGYRDFFVWCAQLYMFFFLEFPVSFLSGIIFTYL
jgi:hypothetical protein